MKFSTVLLIFILSFSQLPSYCYELDEWDPLDDTFAGAT